MQSDKSRQHIYQSISGYIFSHNLVTALLDKTVSIWHRERSAEFISFFSFYNNEIFIWYLKHTFAGLTLRKTQDWQTD